MYECNVTMDSITYNFEERAIFLSEILGLVQCLKILMICV